MTIFNYVLTFTWIGPNTTLIYTLLGKRLADEDTEGARKGDRVLKKRSEDRLVWKHDSGAQVTSARSINLTPAFLQIYVFVSKLMLPRYKLLQ